MAVQTRKSSKSQHYVDVQSAPKQNTRKKPIHQGQVTNKSPAKRKPSKKSKTKGKARKKTYTKAKTSKKPIPKQANLIQSALPAPPPPSPKSPVAPHTAYREKGASEIFTVTLNKKKKQTRMFEHIKHEETTQHFYLNCKMLLSLFQRTNLASRSTFFHDFLAHVQMLKRALQIGKHFKNPSKVKLDKNEIAEMSKQDQDREGESQTDIFSAIYQRTRFLCSLYQITDLPQKFVWHAKFEEELQSITDDLKDLKDPAAASERVEKEMNQEKNETDSRKKIIPSSDETNAQLEQVQSALVQNQEVDDTDETHGMGEIQDMSETHDMEAPEDEMDEARDMVALEDEMDETHDMVAPDDDIRETHTTWNPEQEMESAYNSTNRNEEMDEDHDMLNQSSESEEERQMMASDQPSKKRKRDVEASREDFELSAENGPSKQRKIEPALPQEQDGTHTLQSERTVQVSTAQAATVQIPTLQAPAVQAPTVQAPAVQAPVDSKHGYKLRNRAEIKRPLQREGDDAEPPAKRQRKAPAAKAGSNTSLRLRMPKSGGQPAPKRAKGGSKGRGSKFLHYDPESNAYNQE